MDDDDFDYICTRCILVEKIQLKIVQKKFFENLKASKIRKNNLIKISNLILNKTQNLKIPTKTETKENEIKNLIKKINLIEELLTQIKVIKLNKLNLKLIKEISKMVKYIKMPIFKINKGDVVNVNCTDIDVLSVMHYWSQHTLEKMKILIQNLISNEKSSNLILNQSMTKAIKASITQKEQEISFLIQQQSLIQNDIEKIKNEKNSILQKLVIN